MGKADKNAVKNQITTETNRSLQQSNEGIASAQGRIDQLTPTSDRQKSDVWSGYKNLADTGGINEADRQRLLNPSSGISGYGGGGGGSGSSGNPSYLDVFNELSGKTGGWDPSRLSAVTGAANKLYDTSGNYGDVNKSIDFLQNTSGNYGATDTSIKGLQDFAKTGGVNDTQLGRIFDPTLQEFSKTGGYTDTDISNMRNRGNRTIASTYGAAKDALNRNKLTAGSMGPGWSNAGFKLLRQGAQDIGTNARDTELGIKNAVNTNRMAAAGQLGQLGLGTAQLQSGNTLSGYGTSGNLDINKQNAINAAMESAARLGLSRQAQIDAAMEAAAGIDVNNQQLINQSRLGGASGLQNEALTRASIGASAAAQAAALDAANQRFLISEADQNRATGLGGMLNTYGAAPGELTNANNLLYNYRNSAASQQQGLIGQRVNQGYMPGLGSDIMSGINIASGIAGLASPIFSGIGGMAGGNRSNFGSNTGTSMSGYQYNNPYVSFGMGGSNPNLLPRVGLQGYGSTTNG